MAENDTPNQLEDDDEGPLVVPSHSPLPPPPEVHYTRPKLGAKSSPAPSVSSGAAPLRESPEGDAGPGSRALKLGSGLAAGTTFTASIVAGFLLGQWIDHRWNHTGGTPWATIICSLVGIAAGFLNLFRVISATDRSRKR